MKIDSTKISTLEVLSLARKVANRASTLGACQARVRQRPYVRHLGAIMADAILQPGVNYRTVVYPRVASILDKYPEASTLQGVKTIIHTGRLEEFLLWRDTTKLTRFLELVFYFEQQRIEAQKDLRICFDQRDFREGLLGLSGIGPKTADYLGCLAGVDAVAVDRHIKTFARESGLEIDDYYGLQIIFSYAADLLELSRRDFDSWVWTTISSRPAPGSGVAARPRSGAR